MSHYPALPLETLDILRSTLSKIDADPAPTCSVLELRRILAERIARLEAIAQHVRDLKTAAYKTNRQPDNEPSVLPRPISPVRTPTPPSPSPLNHEGMRGQAGEGGPRQSIAKRF